MGLSLLICNDLRQPGVAFLRNIPEFWLHLQRNSPDIRRKCSECWLAVPAIEIEVENTRQDVLPKEAKAHSPTWRPNSETAAGRHVDESARRAHRCVRPIFSIA
jgi:hypothetical protein